MSHLRNDSHITNQRLSRMFTKLAPVLFEHAQSIRQSSLANQNTTHSRMEQFLQTSTDLKTGVSKTAAPVFTAPQTTLAKNLNLNLPNVFSGNAEMTVGKAMHPTTHAFHMLKAETIAQKPKKTAAQNTYIAKGNVLRPVFSKPRYT